MTVQMQVTEGLEIPFEGCIFQAVKHVGMDEALKRDAWLVRVKEIFQSYEIENQPATIGMEYNVATEVITEALSNYEEQKRMIDEFRPVCPRCEKHRTKDDFVHGDYICYYCRYGEDGED